MRKLVLWLGIALAAALCPASADATESSWTLATHDAGASAPEHPKLETGTLQDPDGSDARSFHASAEGAPAPGVSLVTVEGHDEAGIHDAVEGAGGDVLVSRPTSAQASVPTANLAALSDAS